MKKLHSGKELLAVSAWCRAVKLDNSEALGLRSGPGLGDRDLVTVAQAEGWRGMGGDVPVPLLETLVLPLVMQVIAADDDSTSHLCRNNNAAKDATTDGDITCERALLVDVRTLDRLFRSLEAETNLTEPAALSPANFPHKGDGSLAAESFLVDDVGHGCADGETGVKPRRGIKIERLVWMRRRALAATNPSRSTSGRSSAARLVKFTV
jgi:hypothetical protein